MRTHPLTGPRLLGGLLALLLLGGAVSACGGASVGTSAQEQLSFGVEMARRGLWQEALFRFERAADLDPNNPRILNNMAVAFEAAGRYDDALETYRRALDLAPGNRDLRENYARFVDFYESYRPDRQGGGLDLEPSP